MAMDARSQVSSPFDNAVNISYDDSAKTITTGRSGYILFTNANGNGTAYIQNPGTNAKSLELKADDGVHVTGPSLKVSTALNTNTTSCAKLELVSSTQGLLFPRMTTAQKNAIGSPVSGLVVYDTTLNKLCVYGAAAWETVTSV